jgi:hypothetical protein
MRVPRFQSSNWGWLVLPMLVVIGVRLWVLRGIPLDTDEPQHLHVVWAWSRGLVPYRDVFDNHAPLFHLMYAPVLYWLGERADIVLWMRYAILPLALGVALVVALLVERLWDRRTAVTAILLCCAVAPYMVSSIQFRADALWALLWVSAVAAACGGAWNLRRAAYAGLLLGAAFATSLKTTMLLAGFVYAVVVVYLAMPRERRPSARKLACGAITLFASALAVPAIMVAIVAAKGGLAAMAYCVIQHNMVPGMGKHASGMLRLTVILPALIVIIPVAVRISIRSVDTPSLAARRVLIIVSAMAYLLLMHGFWPLWTRQDMLPVVPLLAAGVSALCFRPPGAKKRKTVGLLAFAVAAGTIIGIAFSLYRYPLMKNALSKYEGGLAAVLATTRDSDPVMDDKGASIYRQRPFYFALEDITLAKIGIGVIEDDIPTRLVETDTHEIWSARMPLKDMRFIDDHYLVGRYGLRVAGHAFDRIAAGTVATVKILFLGEYVMMDAQSMSAVNGVRIDGSVYDSPRWLTMGAHSVSSASGGGYILVWRPAACLVSLRAMRCGA